MDLSDFRIGLEFWCDHKSWRVTDVGSRVVGAICISEATMGIRREDGQIETRQMTGSEAAAIGWFDGPPYGVVERVFDEDDREICAIHDEPS